MLHQSITPNSHMIPSTSEEGLNLHIASMGFGKPLLFVHGATIASHGFYAPIPGRNWMEATAAKGFTVYALDIRGYGKSASKKMWEQKESYAPAADAILDIDDAVNWITNRHNQKPGLLGISWGSVTCGKYASSIGQSKITRLVLAAPIFAEKNDIWRKLIGDPDDPSKLNPVLGAFRKTSLADLMLRVDEELPDGVDWHEEHAVERVIEMAMADDPESDQYDPPLLHSPNGTFADLIKCFNGEAIYSPEDIEVPTMLIRGTFDLTSTRSDALQLFHRISAQEKRFVDIANGGHFISLAKNSSQLYDEVSGFFQADSAKS